jgi:membrane-bound lytic murein transglycosylase D
MAKWWYGVLFALVVVFPSSLPASEKAISSEASTAVQVHPPQDTAEAEQYKTLVNQAGAEVQEHQVQRAEAPQPEIAKGGAPAAPQVQTHELSNPVATRAVDRSIWLFTERIKEKFSLWLSRSGRYLDMMREILKAKNIPEDIAFLSLIESGFNPNAYSVAKAVGPWQFIAATAKRYGLKIDWWRDERRDPVKSTKAAANYLRDLYEMFGSWNLAMAAYNAGEGKILKAVNRSRSDDYWALLNTQYIKKETKEYVPHFMAAKLIASNPDDYGFVDLNYHPPLQYDEVVLDKPVDLDIAAQSAETSLEVIRELNPELRRWSTPPHVSPYILRIPYGKKESFLANLSAVPEEERFSVATYTVKKGDTLKKVSNTTGIPVNVILELNDDKGLKSLVAGEKLCLPPKEKFTLDRDDRAQGKNVALKNKKPRGKKQGSKKVIASLHKKQGYAND